MFEIANPVYVSESPDGIVAVSSNGNKKIYCIFPEKGLAEPFVDGNLIGMKDVGNCEYDDLGRLWVNEITGCKIWCFDEKGEIEIVIGDGMVGFENYDTPFSETHFGWIYDMRKGPNGNIYVLDSGNFAVRMIDLKRECVSLIAGNGTGGYTGDNQDALQATFGHNPDEAFDGPWPLALDDEGSIFIGDTQNHVVRMINTLTGTITTIAGRENTITGQRKDPQETNPRNLNLPRISSLDYANGKLYIPEWDGDLIILAKK